MKVFFANVLIGLKFAAGILGLKKKHYTLSFVYVPEDRTWYIDMPWPGDRYNLAMVAGSDKLLDRLCYEDDGNRVTVEVLPRKKREVHPHFLTSSMRHPNLLE